VFESILESFGCSLSSRGFLAMRWTMLGLVLEEITSWWLCLVMTLSHVGGGGVRWMGYPTPYTGLQLIAVYRGDMAYL
jgi:hypothetical protein